MAKIIDNNNKEVSEIATIAKYFKNPGESTADFMTATKTLTPEDKTYLAHGAAKELGFVVTE